MQVFLTNLSNARFEEDRFRLNDSAGKYGIGHINSYDLEAIKQTDFYVAHKKILDQPKGIGYWLWKPYIISETLRSMEEGDILVYSDAGIELVADIAPLIELCKEQQPILLFQNGNLHNSMWTKRDCFIVMNTDQKKYWRRKQCDAAFALFRKSDLTVQFVQQWLTVATDERAITDMPNVLGKKNLPDFVDHRHDQSILSLQAALHQIPFYRMPTQFGNHYKMPAYRVAGEFNVVNQYHQQPVSFYAAKPMENSPYGQLLYHHRKKSQSLPAQGNNKSFLQHLSTRIRRKLYNYWYRLEEIFSPGKYQ